MMTREELRRAIEQELETILELFDRKNESYGADLDAFHNFRETARRVLKCDALDNRFRVLLAYMDKHLVALTSRGVHDPEAEERLRDIVVYALIGLAMVRDGKPRQKEA